MILREIQKIYHQELDSLFGKEETDSFFYLLIDHFLNLDRLSLALQPNYLITKEEEQPLFEALSRLKLEEPIQYIIGETEFFGLPFKVNKDTLIPRPETEELVAWVLEQVPNTETSLTILDIGTGSGCIPVSLAKYLPQAQVYAIDISEEALKMAESNAKMNGVEVNFIHQDILNISQGESNMVPEKVDIIISNPPYVRQLEKSEMKNNVLKFEPHLALFVEDEDPLLFYRAIARLAAERLPSGGQLFFEINQYLGGEMKQLMTDFGFQEITLKEDMFKNHRMIKGYK